MVEKTSPTHLWQRWTPALLLMALIFLFSSIPGSDMPDLGAFDLSVKKLGHFFGYACLGASYLYALRDQNGNIRMAAWLLAVGFAISDEFHQSFVPGRSPWVVDIGIDALGALLGILILSSFPKLFSKL